MKSKLKTLDWVGFFNLEDFICYNHHFFCNIANPKWIIYIDSILVILPLWDHIKLVVALGNFFRVVTKKLKLYKI